MTMPLAELTIPLTLSEVGAILSIATVVFGAVVAYFAMRFLSRKEYYERREQDEAKADAQNKELSEKLVAIDKRLEVLATSELTSLAKGMDEIRKELERGRETHERLSAALSALETQLAVVKAEADQRAQKKGRA